MHGHLKEDREGKGQSESHAADREGDPEGEIGPPNGAGGAMEPPDGAGGASSSRRCRDERDHAEEDKGRRNGRKRAKLRKK